MDQIGNEMDTHQAADSDAAALHLDLEGWGLGGGRGVDAAGASPRSPSGQAPMIERLHDDAHDEDSRPTDENELSRVSLEISVREAHAATAQALPRELEAEVSRGSWRSLGKAVSSWEAAKPVGLESAEHSLEGDLGKSDATVEATQVQVEVEATQVQQADEEAFPATQVQDEETVEATQVQEGALQAQGTALWGAYRKSNYANTTKELMELAFDEDEELGEESANDENDGDQEGHKDAAAAKDGMITDSSGEAVGEKQQSFEVSVGEKQQTDKVSEGAEVSPKNDDNGVAETEETGESAAVPEKQEAADRHDDVCKETGDSNKAPSVDGDEREAKEDEEEEEGEVVEPIKAPFEDGDGREAEEDGEEEGEPTKNVAPEEGVNENEEEKSSAQEEKQVDNANAENQVAESKEGMAEEAPPRSPEPETEGMENDSPTALSECEEKAAAARAAAAAEEAAVSMPLAGVDTPTPAQGDSPKAEATASPPTSPAHGRKGPTPSAAVVESDNAAEQAGAQPMETEDGQIGAISGPRQPPATPDDNQQPPGTPEPAAPRTPKARTPDSGAGTPDSGAGGHDRRRKRSARARLSHCKRKKQHFDDRLAEAQGTPERGTLPPDTMESTPLHGNLRELPAALLGSPVARGAAAGAAPDTVASTAASAAAAQHRLLLKSKVCATKAIRKLGAVHLSSASGRGLEAQEEEVASVLRAASENGASGSLLLFGSSGSGKSFVVERALRHVKGPAALVRLDGEMLSDDMVTIREISRQLAQRSTSAGRSKRVSAAVAGPVKGSFAQHLAFLLSVLREGEQVTRAMPVIIVLRHFEAFARRGKQTLLYNLLDATQTRGACVVVIGLTEQTDVTSALEKRVKSRLDDRQVHCPQLPFETLQQVLLERVQLPGQDAWNEQMAATVTRDERAVAVLQRLHLMGYSSGRFLRLMSVALSGLCTRSSASEEQLVQAADLLDAERLLEAELLSGKLAGLSLVEYVLVVAMMHLEVIQGRAWSNFEMIFGVAEKFYKRKGCAIYRARKAEARNAFEHLLELNIAVQAAVALDECTGQGRTHVPTDFRAARLMADPEDLASMICKGMGLPTALQQWAAETTTAR